jgi:hypothetical protein
VIESVTIDGAAIALADVFASVTIRHGRGSDDGPLGSTATLSLVNVTRELVAAFRVGDTLDVLLAADEPRFRGRITDAALSDGALAIVAVSSLSWLSRRKVGAVDYPAEAWSARITRVFKEAGALTRWMDLSGTWDEQTGSWSDPVTPAPFVLEVGSSDPELAARAASETTLGQYLGELVTYEPAAIANLPNGSVLVQALAARQAFAEHELAAADVAYAPEFGQTDEVTNEATVEYDAGSVTAVDSDSILRFEERPKDVRTELATLDAATYRAELAISRGSSPDWVVGLAELLTLDTAIGVGSPIRIPELPAWAPADSYLGMVEGWTDQVEANADGALEWAMALALSAPRISGYGLAWDLVTAGLTWDEAGAARWYTPEAIFD